MKTKCNKCDARGYIATYENGSYFGHSCECGWAIEQQELVFKDWSLGDLVGYLNARQIQKGRL